MSDHDQHKAVDYILKSAPMYAKAKSERVYIEYMLYEYTAINGKICATLKACRP